MSNLVGLVFLNLWRITHSLRNVDDYNTLISMSADRFCLKGVKFQIDLFEISRLLVQ